MTKEKLDRLKEVLSIPTHSRNEKLMIEYLKSVLDDKGYTYKIDRLGNIYVTKGEAEFYPCFVSHTDTVHRVNTNMRVVQLALEDDDRTILTGVDCKTMRPSGIGGDDKCGVFLCLEMLDKLDNVKAAFFVSEEIGCIGSRQADPEFFSNVGYAIQYDSPKGNSMSMTLMGKKLFGESTDFGEKVSPLILEHGIDDWAYHPYTDIWPLMDKFKFSCLNLAAGYYNYHTDNEYVVVEDVENAFELGLRLHEQLGESFYERPEDPKPKTNYHSYGSQGRYSYQGEWFNSEGDGVTTFLTEGTDDEDVDENIENGFGNGTIDIDGVIIEEIDDEFYDEWEDFHTEDLNNQNTLPWTDEFDYEEFNGGMTIRHYGTEQNRNDIGDPYHFEW